MIKIPEQLKDLPVLKTLPSIDITKDFILTAHTGSGKTLLIPPYICDARKRLCVLRQPTRKMAQLIHRSLTDLFPDLVIGLITSEDKDTELRYINSYNIIVISDGVLSSIIPKLDKSRTSIIFDECHWMMAITESELVLANIYKQTNPLLQIILLSATISPYIFVSFFESSSKSPVSDSKIRDVCTLSNDEKVNSTIQNQNLCVYYANGTAFPIEKRIIKVSDINDVDKELSEFCYEMRNNKTFGLVFLSTRAEIVSAHKKYFFILPTMYYHADSPTEELIGKPATESESEKLGFFKSNPNGGVIFATVALSTSATLPFTKTLIIDKSNDCCYVESIEQKISTYGIPCDNNTILQMAGRVGRLFPGTATLVTTRDISWTNIIPTNIIPPLMKELPISAALISSSHGIDISKTRHLSNFSPSQISKSLEKLQRFKFIDTDNKITPLGKRALSLPLEPDDAKFFLSTPTSFLSASAAYLSFPQGMFYIIDSSSPNRHSLYKNYTYNSIPLTKISILQDAISNKSNLKNWCFANALNYKRITMSLFNFHQLATKLSKTSTQFEDELLALDFSPDSSTTASYRILLYMLLPKYSVLFDGSGFGIQMDKSKHFSFFSDSEFFSVEDTFMPKKVSGRFSLFKAKNRPEIYGRVSDATLPALPPTGLMI